METKNDAGANSGQTNPFAKINMQVKNTPSAIASDTPRIALPLPPPAQIR